MEVPYRAEIEGIIGGEFVVRSMQRLFEEMNAQPFRVGNNAIRQGVGTPNGSMVGDIGDVYFRQDSAAAGAGGHPGLYFKGKNNGQNTGWAIVPPFVRTETATGTLNDYAINDASLIRWNNASLTTINGLKAGYDGQQVTLVSIGAGQVNLAHQNTGSAAENRLINFVTLGVTPLAPGSGYATYVYDGTTLRWRLAFHDQGAWITPAYAAGTYTGNVNMTWTVQAADVAVALYRLTGKTLTYVTTLNNTTVGGTPSTGLQIQLPNSWTGANNDTRGGCPALDNGTVVSGMIITAGANLTVYRDAGIGNWAASTDNTTVQGGLTFEIT